MIRKKPKVTYTPDELKAAIAVLQGNSYHCFEPGDAAGIVHALFAKGFRIIHIGYTGYGMDDVGEPKS